MPLNISSENFNDIFREAVQKVLMSQDLLVKNQTTREIFNAQITLTNIKQNQIDFTKTNAFSRQPKYEKYQKEELNWYLSGNLDSKSAPSSFWQKIADSKGNIQSNYGFLVLHELKDYSRPPICSFENAFNLVKDDKHTRQAILHYNLPTHYKNNQKDIPCTVCTQLMIRNDRLNFLVFQRSCDMYRGLPYDLLWHCHLIEKFTDQIKSIYSEVEPGSLTMVFGSLHIYKEHFEFFNQFLERRFNETA